MRRYTPAERDRAHATMWIIWRSSLKQISCQVRRGHDKTVLLQMEEIKKLNGDNWGEGHWGCEWSSCNIWRDQCRVTVTGFGHKSLFLIPIISLVNDYLASLTCSWLVRYALMHLRRMPNHHRFPRNSILSPQSVVSSSPHVSLHLQSCCDRCIWWYVMISFTAIAFVT